MHTYIQIHTQTAQRMRTMFLGNVYMYYTYIHIHTYTYTYINTYIHTYIHPHTYRDSTANA